MKIWHLILPFALLTFVGAGCARPATQTQTSEKRYAAEAPSAPKQAPTIPENAKNIPLPVVK